MVLLAVTADTWIVTGLGFGIVLALLFCLVFILQFFGWTMQKIEAAPAKPAEPEKANTTTNANADDEIAAVAMALYLANASHHDAPTSMISLSKHDSVWNPKSEGFNNIGF